MSNAIGFEIQLGLPFDRAIALVQSALSDEGFGVLTRVDLHKAFKVKLGIDFRPYAILGACNPMLAHRAIGEHPEVGLLLPCNVTVEATTEDASTVRIIDPEEMMRRAGLDEDPTLAEIGHEARERLTRVVEALRDESTPDPRSVGAR
jgi:uncharacterized protein (DUF302 family)